MTRARAASAPSIDERALVHLSRNFKTGLILFSIALVFFVGVIVRHWLWR